ncbi:hypothetical protein HDV00_010459 [Rhizophlyctis rosea]|nr:hypothetical protein HDV00_010459 [Rhizophlyctis rosea]
MGPTSDEHLARLLQQEEDELTAALHESAASSSSSSLAAVTQALPVELDLEDPTPDLHGLFLQFNEQYFHGKLASVEVRWSNRMTCVTLPTYPSPYDSHGPDKTTLPSLCAGMCYYFNGGYCSIRLSEPLLKFRPREDFINTLLHEMIHAYLFVTKNNRDRDGHGPEFCGLMKEINRRAATNITVYHNFRDEVNHYRVHVWKCDGLCQHRPPFFGTVRRSMNRAPQPADRWWNDHQQSCGGSYHKIAGPDLDDEGNVVVKKKRKRKGDGEDGEVVGKGQRRVDDMFAGVGRKKVKGEDGEMNVEGEEAKVEVEEGNGEGGVSEEVAGAQGSARGGGVLARQDERTSETPPSNDRFPGTGHRLGGPSPSIQPPPEERPTTSEEGARTHVHQSLTSQTTQAKVNCPVCGVEKDQAEINDHLDGCLS